METKLLPPVKVLYYSTQTTLKTLGEYVLNIAKQLYTESARLDLLPTGPIYWLYYGADGNPDTIFTLEIALPVNHTPIRASIFKYKVLPAFNCIDTVHYGKWETLPATYQKLIPQIMTNGHALSGFTREVYLNIDLNHPQYNITQVQVGVA